MNESIRDACKCSLAAEVLQSQGSLQLRVTGLSMLPTLWPGDLLSVQAVDFEQIQPQDIVLYQREGRFFIHRLVRKTFDNAFVARGDCMSTEDAPACAGALLGKVTAVSRRGAGFQPVPRFSLMRRVSARLLQWDFAHRILLKLWAGEDEAGSARETQSVTV